MKVTRQWLLAVAVLAVMVVSVVNVNAQLFSCCDPCNDVYCVDPCSPGHYVDTQSHCYYCRNLLGRWCCYCEWDRYQCVHPTGSLCHPTNEWRVTNSQSGWLRECFPASGWGSGGGGCY